MTTTPTACLAWGVLTGFWAVPVTTCWWAAPAPNVLDGGADEDTASYAGSAAAVMVNLGTGTASGGDAEGDTLSGVEHVEGSAHGDTLTGDDNANRLFGLGGVDRLLGGAGNDVLEGGAGADVLDGGADEDTVSYAGSAAAVMVELATGTVSGGDAEGRYG